MAAYQENGKGRAVFVPGNLGGLWQFKPDDLLNLAAYYENLAVNGYLANPKVAIGHAMRVLDIACGMDAAQNVPKPNSG